MAANKRRGLGRGLEALLGDAEVAKAIAVGAENDLQPSQQATSDKLQTLPLDKIQRGQYQPRVHFDPQALQELADSIRAQGVLQPIVVRPLGDGYELIAGERRWRAAQLAELHEIPAVIRSGLADEVVAAVALIENIQREDLNPIEEARAFARLIEEFELTHQEVGEAVGRSRAAVSNLLRLLELNIDVRKMLEENKIDMGHARALLSLSSQQQLEAAHRIYAKALSVRETEKLVKSLQQDQSTNKSKPNTDPDIKRLQQSLSDTIAAKVEIQHSKQGKGKLVIHYASVDELDGILKRIK